MLKLLLRILILTIGIYVLCRDLVLLKSLVRNRAQPEGSIAEGFIANECLTFCSRYLQDVETTFTRPQRNSDHQDSVEPFLFSSGGRILGKAEGVVLDNMALAQAHRYVLLHYEGITQYRRYFNLCIF